jgi:hypothetical protein
MRNTALRALLATGAVYAVIGIASAAASTEPPGSSADETIDETVAAAPVEFTACANPGPNVTEGTEEVTAIFVPDGEMTIERGRDYTWQSSVSDVSDPRLDGTWYNSINGDTYTLPGGDPGPTFDAWTHRIENDEGAWQGSLLEIDFADGESFDGNLVMIGEGAYEGLTAVGIIQFGAACPNTRGYIIEGTIPEPPVPNTGG